MQGNPITNYPAVLSIQYQIIYGAFIMLIKVLLKYLSPVEEWASIWVKFAAKDRTSKVIKGLLGVSFPGSRIIIIRRLLWINLVYALVRWQCILMSGTRIS